MYFNNNIMNFINGKYFISDFIRKDLKFHSLILQLKMYLNTYVDYFLFVIRYIYLLDV